MGPDRSWKFLVCTLQHKFRGRAGGNWGAGGIGGTRIRAVHSTWAADRTGGPDAKSARVRQRERRGPHRDGPDTESAGARRGRNTQRAPAPPTQSAPRAPADTESAGPGRRVRRALTDGVPGSDTGRERRGDTASAGPRHRAPGPDTERRGPTRAPGSDIEAGATESAAGARHRSGHRERESAGPRHRECRGPTQRAPGPDTH